MISAGEDSTVPRKVTKQTSSIFTTIAWSGSSVNIVAFGYNSCVFGSMIAPLNSAACKLIQRRFSSSSITSVGELLGAVLGFPVGCCVGLTVGRFVGAGDDVGVPLDFVVGEVVGIFVGLELGC